jgi:hypothetical protein
MGGQIMEKIGAVRLMLLAIARFSRRAIAQELCQGSVIYDRVSSAAIENCLNQLL